MVRELEEEVLRDCMAVQQHSAVTFFSPKMYDTILKILELGTVAMGGTPYQTQFMSPKKDYLFLLRMSTTRRKKLTSPNRRRVMVVPLPATSFGQMIGPQPAPVPAAGLESKLDENADS